MDLAELARLQVLDRRGGVRCAAALGADLHDPAVLPRGLDHLAALPDAVAGRLLDVDVLAGLAGPDRAQGVPVVGRGDHQRVDALVVEHAPEVLDGLGPLAAQRLDLGGPAGEQARVDVGQVGDLDVGPLGEVPIRRIARARARP